ncbi:MULTISPECIES: L,D-transpeptidase [unclassified Beijerinckia]|uniref:L,D-transpeptidase n=1 Tax=unclassified Beijerinckia TaxID=2638183 RepID=UPI0008943F9B|nr:MULTISPECIES: L,D-transpeptidase [unclassified Beijerinckia]MDH7797387.1 hypothetical protein [Beijerinckia sp. GAS462]SEC83539.1 L,D-transpeptidase catalytic domain [Beijerinckia sp. 28-YEA-48]
MRFLALVLAIVGGLFAANHAAEAAVRISIDLSSQRMHVTNGAGESTTWAVSTARSGYATPRGTFRPYSLQRMHYSRKYHMSPMPHSIFFLGGYAIHGTGSVSQLGRPASHGCIRLAPGNAAKLFSMVQREGASISISGSPPGNTRFAKAHGKKKTYLASRMNKKKHMMVAQRRTHAHPMAYAPVHRTPSVKTWQHNPALR